jgi:hypothetical protein
MLLNKLTIICCKESNIVHLASIKYSRIVLNMPACFGQSKPPLGEQFIHPERFSRGWPGMAEKCGGKY